MNPAPPPPSQQTEYAAPFPTSGLDATCEYGRQPTDTAPSAVNVLAFDLLERRRRGGSRWGLTRLFASPLVSGSSPVWHLALLVDPQSPALATEATITPTDGFEPDPSTNNFRQRIATGLQVRTGGSAKRPKKRNNPTSPPSDGSYTATFGQIDSGDGFKIVSLTFASSGNGSFNGLSFTVTVAIGPPVAVPPPGTEEMYFFVSAAAYDSISLGTALLVLTAVPSAADRVYNATINGQ